MTDADQYAVWSTDSRGNYRSNLVPVGSGCISALDAFDPTLHSFPTRRASVLASLVVPAVIESFGSTSLVEVGNLFYLDSISSGTGPQLKYGGAAVTAGQFGGWTPIGAEQTSSGYDVAWKMTSADE